MHGFFFTAKRGSGEVLPAILLWFCLAQSAVARVDPPAEDCAAYLKPGYFQSDDWSQTPPDAQRSIAWQISGPGLHALDARFLNRRPLILSLATAILSKNFGWLNGDPGGAKTLLVRAVLDAEIRSFREAEKRIFIRQFHLMVTEGTITGFPKFEKMITEGKFEIETSTSLVADKYVYCILDELEKANPATAAATLSVLNERKAFLGGKIVDVVLLAGFSTSNKNTDQFVEAFGTDYPTAEALLDRFMQKYLVANQQATIEDQAILLRLVREQGAENSPKPVLALHYLSDWVDRVRLPREVLWNAVKIVTELEEQFTVRADRALSQRRSDPDFKKAYTPASQFSIRTVLGQIRLWKARFLVEQLWQGVPENQIRWTIENRDLVFLSEGTIYGGPGSLRAKRIRHTVSMRNKRRASSPRYKVPIEIDPYAGVVYYQDLEDPRETHRIDVDLNHFTLADTSVFLPPPSPADPKEEDIISDLVRTYDRSVLVFEEDGQLDGLLTSPTLSDGAALDFENLRAERTTFLNALNGVLANPGRSPAPPVARREMIQVPPESVARIEALEQLPSKTDEQRIEQGWIQSQLYYRFLSERYFEADHLIRALYVSLLAGTNLFMSGPAGSGKTSLLWRAMQSAIDAFNEYNPSPEPAELFMYQFNKLTPEGLITGFPITDRLIRTGRMEYEDRSSLVHRRNKLVLLDETDKGPSGALTALLGPLNERENFRNEPEPVGLHMAAMTSNKDVWEMIESFGIKDRPTAIALLDRALNKAYASNKFSSPPVLLDFLWTVELENQRLNQGGKPRTVRPLAIWPLRDLLARVVIPEEIESLGLETREAFFKAQFPKAKTSLQIHEQDEINFPHVYRMASEPSDRTLIALFTAQWKAAFLVDQLARGTAYEKIRWTMGHADVVLLGQGLTYWGPWEPVPTSDKGVLQYRLGGILPTLKARKSLNQRQRFAIEYIHDEAETFLKATNASLSALATAIRSSIADNPAQFHFLVPDPQGFAQEILQQSVAPPTVPH